MSDRQPAGEPGDPGGPEPDRCHAGDADQPPERHRPPLLRGVAAVLAVAVGAAVVGGVVRTLTSPVSGLLHDALPLAGDPDVQRWQEAVVVVTAWDGSATKARTGTGFNIRPAGLVVTSRHVVAGARSVEVRFRDGGIHRAVEVRLDPSADLAVVRLNGAGLGTLPLAGRDPPPVGTAVTIVGNPLGFPRLAVTGEIAGYAGARSDPVMVVDAPVHPGHSGSPVLDPGGRVIGVLFAAAITGDGGARRGYAVPVNSLHRFLDRVAP
ncbi:MAG TPA: serine protease [Bacillota bacterium]